MISQNLVNFVQRRTGLDTATIESGVRQSHGLRKAESETEFPYFAFDRNEAVQAERTNAPAATQAHYERALARYDRGTGLDCFGYVTELVMSAGMAGLFGPVVSGILPSTVDIGERQGLVAINFQEPEGK